MAPTTSSNFYTIAIAAPASEPGPLGECRPLLYRAYLPSQSPRIASERPLTRFAIYHLPHAPLDVRDSIAQRSL